MTRAHQGDIAKVVPVIDLTGPLSGARLQQLAEEVRSACLGTGFFYVSNHGIPQSVVDNIFETAARYFSMPLEVRMQHLRDSRFRRGYIPFGTTTVPGNAADIKERFEWGIDVSLEDPYVIARKPLYGPNRWPDDMPWLREAAEQWGTGVSVLGLKILKLLAVSLAMPEDFFEAMFTRPCTTHSMNHYPTQESPSKINQYGSAAHTDYGLLTVLAQDPIGGLEIRMRDGGWLAAPFIPGTLVVNLGDLFKSWTNDVYVSNEHRVVNTTGKERYSFPTFFNPEFDTLVRTMPSCISEANPRRYPDVTAGEYVFNKLQIAQGYA